MLLIEKVQRLVDRHRRDPLPVGSQIDFRLNALMERASHAQSATQQSLTEVRNAMAVFALDGASIHEQRVELVINRLDDLPWKRRQGDTFSFAEEGGIEFIDDESDEFT